MKFLRHLTAVVLAVAVIAGLGMLWAHASGGPGRGQAPSHEALLRLEQSKEQIRTGVIRVHPDNGFHLADTGNLIRTCEIEAVLAAVAITAGVIRRQRRGGGGPPPGCRAGRQVHSRPQFGLTIRGRSARLPEPRIGS